MRVDWDAVGAHIDAMDDAASVALARLLAEELRAVAPVTPDTRAALALLREAREGDPGLIDRLEARRNEIEDEFFQLDAENDEEAAVAFGHARAMTALLQAMKGVYSDAVCEAAHVVDDPREMLRKLGVPLQ